MSDDAFDDPFNEDEDVGLARARPLHWGGLGPADRWRWFVALWEDVCALRIRYRLPVRSEWWRDAIQVEALAAVAIWVERYDRGDWDDPPGKLALLFELERIAVLLREGSDAFSPQRDWPAFARHVTELCADPGDGGTNGGTNGSA